MDKDRVKQAVQHPTCSCKCSAPIGLMMKICLAFWCLSKSAQDSILWSLQVSDGDRRKRYYDIEGWAPCAWPGIMGFFFLSWDTSNNSPKMTWRNFFKYPLNFQWNTFTTCLANQSGHRVCREAWLRLLGVGKNRLRRTKRRHRGQDERSMKCGSLEHFTFFCETCKRADSSVNIQVVVQHNTWTFAFGDLETKAPNPTCFQNPAFMFGPRISQTSCKSNGLREGFFHSFVLDSWWINDDKETWTNGSRLFVWNSKPAAP